MESVVNQIIHYEQQLLAKKGPIDNLTHLINDEFLEYGSKGEIHDKKEVARWLSVEDYSDGKGSEFEAKLLSSDVILLTYLCELKKNAHSESKLSRRISIWRKKNDAWQMIFHQGMSLAP
ncbi:MAG: DUF4440 domain-containing protein [Legionella sp.]